MDVQLVLPSLIEALGAFMKERSKSTIIRLGALTVIIICSMVLLGLDSSTVNNSSTNDEPEGSSTHGSDDSFSIG